MSKRQPSELGDHSVEPLRSPKIKETLTFLWIIWFLNRDNWRYHECTLAQRWAGANLSLSLLKTSRTAKMCSGFFKRRYVLSFCKKIFWRLQGPKRCSQVSYYLYFQGFGNCQEIIYSFRKGGMLKGSNISITEDMSRFFVEEIACFHGRWLSDEFERPELNWESSSGSQKRWKHSFWKFCKTLQPSRQTQQCPAICSMTRRMSTEGKSLAQFTMSDNQQPTLSNI